MKIGRVIALGMACAFAGLWSAAASATPTGDQSEPPLYIVVSRPDQKLTVYRGTDAVATSRVSTGKNGHITPTGIYSILQKARFHRSNKYSNAPMPFMQRITWSGIALHGSNSVPAYPASHGCIRLPPAFAKELYKMTGLGAHVVITNREVAPREVDDPVLFQPVTLSASASDWPSGNAAGLRSTIDTTQSIPSTPAIGHSAPIRMLITRITRQQMVRDAQRLLNKIGYDVGDVDGYIGPDTMAGIRGFQTLVGMPRTATVSSELMSELYRMAGEGKPPLGHLYVRREFKPVFDAPVSISDPQQPLGTHFLVASFAGGDQTARWFDISMQSRIPKSVRKADDIEADAGDETVEPIADVLDRISVASEVRQRVSQMLTPGSSLIIADSGMSNETGKGTDFVVETGY